MTWSEMGKQTAQAKEVYLTQSSTANFYLIRIMVMIPRNFTFVLKQVRWHILGTKSSYFFFDKQLNVQTLFQCNEKPLTVTTVSEDYVTYVLAPVSLSARLYKVTHFHKVKAFRRNIPWSFRARFSNLVKEIVLAWFPALSILRRQLRCHCRL